MTLTAAIAPVSEALAKEHVTLNEYIQLQRTQNPGEVHRDYSPYKPGANSVDVEVYSSVHGSFLLENFNCETLVPYSPNDNVRQILATEGSIASIHAGLGYRNRTDSESITRAMAVLARGVEIITPNDASNLRGIEHLEDTHGIELFDIQTAGGRRHLIPNGNMPNIISACSAQLNL